MGLAHFVGDATGVPDQNHPETMEDGTGSLPSTPLAVLSSEPRIVVPPAVVRGLDSGHQVEVLLCLGLGNRFETGRVGGWGEGGAGVGAHTNLFKRLLSM